MRTKRVGTAVGVVCSAWCGGPLAQAVEFVDAGRGAVKVYVPTSYTPDDPLPLIVLLHGFMNDGDIAESQYSLSTRVESERFLYATPDGNTNFLGMGYWNGGACCDLFGSGVDDSSYLRTLVETIKDRYAVDPGSVHFMGFSNGGFMTYRMACEHADLVASVLVHAGQSTLDPAACAPSEPVSVLHIHSVDDGVIGFNGGCIPFGGCYPSAPDSVISWATYNGCAGVLESNGPPFDLDAAVAGNETTPSIYRAACARGAEVEFWTQIGSEHSPDFYAPSLGESPTDNRLAPLAVEWLLSHRKDVACPGDSDGSLTVDLDDLLSVVLNFGLQGGGPGDVNGDATVDLDDLLEVVLNFGVGCA